MNSTNYVLQTLAGSGLHQYLVPAILLAFGVIYVLNHFLGTWSGNRDPLLGVRVFLTLLLTIAGQVAAFALALLATSLMESVSGSSQYSAPNFWGQPLRAAAGFFLGSLLTGVYPLMVYRGGSLGASASAVERQALGLNAILCGLAFAGSCTTAMVFAIGNVRGLGLLGSTVVYFIAMVLCGSLLLKGARKRMRSLPRSHGLDLVHGSGQGS